MSRAMLAFHTLVFSTLVLGCIVSPLIAVQYPDLFRTYSLWVFGGTGVLILASWYFYQGACPLTVWENQFRKSEGRPTYAGSCIDHHAKEWFRLSPPRHFSSVVTLGVLVIPLATRFLM